ncbi:putative disease resistance protein RGA1 [Abrus precatorius]|uniref:Disease resistance protein RGA1 n=1 Tax=Abrus precatorius TaxID=3816 RepID=A0A8B8MNI5_ABRPR|nr:putative disease resistance protein RGA1 [Abrus precatorius]
MTLLMLCFLLYQQRHQSTEVFSLYSIVAFLKMDIANSVLEHVSAHLFSIIRAEFAAFSGIKSNAEELSSNLDRTRSILELEDAEERQITHHSIKDRLMQLREVVYLAEDTLDEYSLRSNRLGGFSSFRPKNIMFRYKVGRRLRFIKREIHHLMDGLGDYSRIQLNEGVLEVRQLKPTVFGRVEDEVKILEFLLDQACAFDSPSIYPIVGIGGVGKTTMAQLVYNNERVSTHFSVKIWVSVSQNFSVKRILCSIVDSIAREKYDVYDLDVIERKARELLKNKRYLLVLDDVWMRSQELEFGLSQEKWEKLKSVLLGGSKGASVLVSTRDMGVATMVGTCDAHHLFGLSEADCWLLFKHYAFGPNREESEELVEIGKEIIKRCEGLPLATMALGDLMRSRSGVQEWLEVRESWSWRHSQDGHSQDGNSVMSALRLSYSDLTPTTKLCFAFCAIFPKNTEIMKEDLIRLWMANGFISSTTDLEVEEVGNRTWNELCQKSFFKDVKKDVYSGDISFKMHDLVHDLAQSVSGIRCMILENANMTNLSERTLHIGFGSGLLSFSKGAFQKVESLRTLYQFEFSLYNTISGYFPTNSSLRVLSTSYFFKLSSLKRLIHLRYLQLYGFDMKYLPNSIYSLGNLETLKLIYCRKLVCLPKHLTRLQNLRHLVITECHSLSCMFPYMHKLSYLRTLTLFIVSSKAGHNLAQLSDLNLGGKLSIEGLQNVGSLSETQKAKLKDKINLHELCLSWDNNGETKSNAIDPEEVLEALQPHPNLKTLRIYDYEGSRLSSWIGNLNLVALELFDCKKCLQLPSLGKLPLLRKLEIYSMDDVQYLDDDESYGAEELAFPSLEELEVRGLPNLQRLLKVERVQMFPSISNVTIDDCSKLQLPSLPSIKQLNVRGCSHELLRSISSFSALTFLNLSGGGDLTSLPKEMLINLTCLETMILYNFPKMKALPDKLSYLNALKHLEIRYCGELESLPQHGWECLRFLHHLEIAYCERLRSLPEGVQQVNSLEVLTIECCPELEKRCKKGTGEDWDKIAHVPNVILLQ